METNHQQSPGNPLTLDAAEVPKSENSRPQHMAFTIHFTDNSNGACTKSVRDSVNNYALKHRRNQSVPSTDVNKNTKGKVNSALAVKLSPVPTRKGVAPRRAGYHSEGYFSSDQEEDLRNKSDFFVKKLKTLEKGFRTTNLAQEKKNMAEHNSQTKLNNSPHMGRHEFGDFRVDEPTLKIRLSDFQSYNNSNNVDVINSPQVLSRDEWLASPSGDDIEPEIFDNVLHIDDEEGLDNDLLNDAASETGTYTIDRDNILCDEEELAIQEGDEAVVGGVQLPSDALGGDISDLSSYRNGSDWINDWATQVAQHNHHQEPLVAGLPPLPAEKHVHHSPRKASPSTSTHIPSPLHSPSGTLPRSGHRGPLSPSPRHSPLVPLEHNDETQSFLRATESVVCAMQARMSLSLDSGGESDLDTSHSYQLIKRGGSVGDGRQLVRRSSSASNGSSYRAPSRTAQSEDSSSEASEVKAKKPEPPPPQMKYNRAFSLRRARLDCEPEPTPVSETKTKVETVRTSASKLKRNVQPVTKPNIPLQPSASATNVTKPKALSRTDCGRFSVRAPKAVPQSTPAVKQPATAVKKGSKKTGGRSNSTLSSREVEFQNWKRRKSYDPMKAAAEGKKKDAAKKATFSNSMTQSTTTVEEMTESHQNPVLRSASFHGTVGMVPTYISSEDEDSPTSEYPSMLEPVAGSPVKLSGDGAHGGSRVSLHSTTSNSSFRGRTKLEALDSLVMTALLGLSNKLRASSCVVLKKLRYLYEEDSDKTEQLSAIIEILESSTQPGSPQGKSSSKELSGTLKNMKQIEYVFKVLDEILFDDEEFDDLEGDTTLQ